MKAIYARLGSDSAVLQFFTGGLALHRKAPITENHIIEICPLQSGPASVFHDFHGSPVPIISAKLYDVMAAIATTGIQYITPTTQTNIPDGTSYRIVHCMNIMKCLDQEASDMDRDGDGEIEAINSAVIKPDLESQLKTENIHMIRCAEFPRLYLISDVLADALSACDASGLGICSPEAWYSDITLTVYAKP